VDARHGEACAAVLQACKAAGVACGIFTLNVDGAIARRKDGYPIVVVANDIDIVASGFGRAMKLFSGKGDTLKAAAKTSTAPVGYLDKDEEDDDVSDLLVKFAAFIADGRIRVVDLTQTLKPSTPVIQLPPPFAP